jgi:hypothetical protein
LLPYFPYHFTFQLGFLPYFPYHFTFRLTFLQYFPDLITIQLSFLPYFSYLFTIFFHIFPIFSLFNLRFFHMFQIFFSLFLMILSNQNFLLTIFADFPRLILLCSFWKYKRMIKILTSYTMTMVLWCLLSEQ